MMPIASASGLWSNFALNGFAKRACNLASAARVSSLGISAFSSSVDSVRSGATMSCARAVPGSSDHTATSAKMTDSE
ncbi:MAG TPA: hypothetical protein VMF30_15270 [Pirellulales bacterium]|nr:hypothetical protein [Pirellulales bacterium]